jgi:hypothetical protein
VVVIVKNIKGMLVLVKIRAVGIVMPIIGSHIVSILLNTSFRLWLSLYRYNSLHVRDACVKPTINSQYLSV